MPRPTRWRDLLPGVAIIVVLVVGTAATLKYARIGRLAGETVRFFTAFPAAHNVMSGTEVWLNGSKIGRVESVQFAPPSVDTLRRVVLELEIVARHREQVRANSMASLRTGGRVLGSTVVYITAGTPAAPVLTAGDTITGRPETDLGAMARNFGDASKDFPRIVANVRLLSQSLESARGTIGALTTLDAPQRFEALRTNASKLTDRATNGNGTVALALRRRDVLDRARAAAAQADSLRQLLAGEQTSLGRFRRDSTLLVTVGSLRNEVSIVRSLLAEPRGTLGRAGQDSIITIQLVEMEKQLGELFTDIKRRPFRYIAF